MRYSQIMHDAWELTVQRPKLKWFVFVPSFAAVLFFGAQVAWQVYTYALEFRFKELSVFDGLESFYGFLENNGLLGWAIALTVFVVIFHFAFAAWVFSTQTLSIRSHFENPEKPLRLRQKMIEGFYYFFKIFRLNAILSPFQLISVLFMTATLFRFFHGTIFHSLYPIMIGYGIVAFIVSLFTIYAPYFILFEGMKVKPAIVKSIGLCFIHIERTIGLMLLMFLVNLRIIVNVVVVLGIPVLILSLVSYFATSALFGLAVLGALLIGIGIAALAAYLTALVEVFSTAVWERAYQNLRHEQRQHEDPHVIEDIQAE